jgi:hypothetical protein
MEQGQVDIAVGYDHATCAHARRRWRSLPIKDGGRERCSHCQLADPELAAACINTMMDLAVQTADRLRIGFRQREGTTWAKFETR